MPTFTFFDNIDASQPAISEVFTVGCGQDMRYLIGAIKTGMDGNPILYFEDSFDGENWYIIKDSDTDLNYYTVDIDNLAIRDSYLFGEHLRFRYEPNGVTTGTFSLKMGYKTKV